VLKKHTHSRKGTSRKWLLLGEKKLKKKEFLESKVEWFSPFPSFPDF